MVVFRANRKIEQGDLENIPMSFENMDSELDMGLKKLELLPNHACGYARKTKGFIFTATLHTTCPRIN